MVKPCKGCGKALVRRENESSYHFKNRVTCNRSCSNKAFPKRQPTGQARSGSLRIKQQAVNYKGGRCQSCGYNRCLMALQFHHLDPTQKDFEISQASLPWDLIKQELDKCILVCANCHTEIHAGLTTLGDVTVSPVSPTEEIASRE